MKNNAHKKLIEEFLAEEKFTDRLETWTISSITEKTDELLAKEFKKWIVWMFSSKEIAQKKFHYYLENLLPKKKQKFNLELDNMLYQLAEYQENHEYKNMYMLARKIFTEHKDILSFDTASNILLILVNDFINNESYEDAMILLSSIEAHQKHLSQENKTQFLIALNRCLYMIWTNTQNKFYLSKVIDYSHQLLNNSSIDKNILKEIFVIQINALWLLWDNKPCLLAIKEYLRVFSLDKNDELAPQIMYIQWEIYESLRKYNLAIKSFRLYLKFHPNDQTVKTKIRQLSKKEWEGGE